MSSHSTGGGAHGQHCVLLVSCLDQPGIVAALSTLIYESGGNVIDLQQHTDPVDGAFFQRIEFELDNFTLGRNELTQRLAPIVERFEMQCRVMYTDDAVRLAILASREPHCLQDLLARWRSGELPAEVRVVVSNHPDHADLCARFGVSYHHLPVTPQTLPHQEREVAAILAHAEVDLVVLARYMQILSEEFVSAWPGRIINIHHSFLPAFQGARPYHQAHGRGVKLIGVTAHYVTADLDEGPIIDQDVTRVSHRDGVEALRRRGRDLEVIVLARAVRAHLEHRVLIHGNRTVVFEG
jgi:formyltetrahydrofolate deformylase